MIIMKFGGTSVESAEAIARMTEIVRGRVSRVPVVVVSAFSKVTDSLYRLCESLEDGRLQDARRIIGELRERHIRTLCELFGADRDGLYIQSSDFINATLDELAGLANVVNELGELSDRSRARIISVGEILSSNIICAALNHSSVRTALVDARNFMITDGNCLKGRPVMSQICRRAPECLLSALKGNDAVITQGFVSSSASGVTTVLGRGGSDYTASLIGSAMDAEEIEIWTDVDGIFSADPRRVHGTISLRNISFEEAAEMAHFGAKVLHPSTILPAVEKNIPVRVLNSRNPDNAGTLILQDAEIPEGIKSISFKENITVINIFSTTMINSFGFLAKVFEIFGRNRVSVDLISTSEANVSLTLEQGQALDEVVDELSGFARVSVENDKSQISVIGKNLMDVRGLCARVFSTLEDYKVNMVSQGASAINLSFVVERGSLLDIVGKLHKNLFENGKDSD